MSEPSSSTVLRADHGAVRVLTMNRPEKLNALNTELTTTLLEELWAAARAPEIRVIVLTGAGRGFCAGADVTEFRHLIPAGSSTALYTRRDNGTNGTYYLTSDHLGSGDLVLDSAARVRPQ